MDKAFWQSVIDAGYAIPEGQSLTSLTDELLSYLGSPDPVLRDEIAYPVLATWISKEYYMHADLWNMAVQLSRNLTVGLGEQGTDSVLLRSFSLLALTSIIYRDSTHSWLEGAEVRQLFEQALTYFAAEKDLRGYDNEKGWLHAIAHAADYLFVFSLHSVIQTPDLERIMNTIATKISESVIHTYLYDEDERLVRAVMGVLQRNLLTVPFLAAWLEQLIHPGGRIALDADFESGKLMDIARNEAETCARHNIKHFLRSLYFQLLSPGFAGLAFVQESPPVKDELLLQVEHALREIRTWC